MTQQRDNWGSKLAFILAASGSAIGLGNIWRFPTVAYQNGGAAFVQIYILFVLLIGFVILIGEIAIGRSAQRNPIGAFRKLAPGSPWKLVGVLGVLTAWGVLSFYSVVAGWTLSYIFTTAGGAFNHTMSAKEITAVFSATVASPGRALFWHFAFMLLTVGVVVGGVKHGIERWSKILMPMLLLILVLLVIRSVTLEGAEVGLAKFFRADWSKVDFGTFVNALGQAVFSMSLGAGTMITYGSYMNREENILHSAGMVALLDTTIAILAGLAIFPALFTMTDVEPEVGAKLIFIVLPRLFSEIPFGTLFGTGFFILLGVAALTSSISLLEVPVAYFVDERKWSRKRATVFCAIIAFCMGIFSALSVGAVPGLSAIVTLGDRTLGFLDLMDLISGQCSMTFGAMMVAIFVGWRWGTKNLLEEISHNGHVGPARKLVAFLIRWVCPLVMLFLAVYILMHPSVFA